MALSESEIAALLRLISRTKAEELDCDACLAHIAELVESSSPGRETDLLEAVKQHLSICPECQEEYEILRATIESEDPPA